MSEGSHPGARHTGARANSNSRELARAGEGEDTTAARARANPRRIARGRRLGRGEKARQLVFRNCRKSDWTGIPRINHPRGEAIARARTRWGARPPRTPTPGADAEKAGPRKPRKTPVTAFDAPGDVDASPRSRKKASARDEERERGPVLVRVRPAGRRLRGYFVLLQVGAGVDHPRGHERARPGRARGAVRRPLAVVRAEEAERRVRGGGGRQAAREGRVFRGVPRSR